MTTNNDSEEIRYVIIDENLENGGTSDSYSFTVSGPTAYHQNLSSQQHHSHLQQQQHQQMLRYNHVDPNGYFLIFII